MGTVVERIILLTEEGSVPQLFCTSENLQMLYAIRCLHNDCVVLLECCLDSLRMWVCLVLPWIRGILCRKVLWMFHWIVCRVCCVHGKPPWKLSQQSLYLFRLAARVHFPYLLQYYLAVNSSAGDLGHRVGAASQQSRHWLSGCRQHC